MAAAPKKNFALAPYLDVIKATLNSALCINNFASQIVERHNKPEIEVGASGPGTSPELLLNPVVIHRSKEEYVCIEAAVNSVRISIKVKQLDEMDEILARKFKKAQRAVDDFVRPNATQIKETRDSVVDPLRRLVSPKFFSTLEGEVVEGLSGVPSPQEGRPVLLVGNHQLFGADLSILVDEFLRDRDLLIRGLAHPVATNAPSLIDGNQQQGPRPSPSWWNDGRRRDGFTGQGAELRGNQILGAPRHRRDVVPVSASAMA